MAGKKNSIETPHDEKENGLSSSEPGSSLESLEILSEGDVIENNAKAEKDEVDNVEIVASEEKPPKEPKEPKKKKKKEKLIVLGDKTYTEEDLFTTFDGDPRAVSAVNVDSTITANLNDLFKVVGNDEQNVEHLDAVPYSYWRMVFRELMHKPMTIICIVLLVIIILLAIFGPMMHYYAPYEVTEGGVVYATNTFKDQLVAGYHGWSSQYWFGLCGQNMGSWFEGCDMWSCVWEGTRLSLLVSVVVALIEVVLGILIGAAWGYFKWLDPILIEFRNFVYNIPEILLDILLMQFFSQYMKQYGFLIIVLLLSMFSWISLASFVRNQIIIIRNREYNIASQTLGSKSGTMITHNLLPYLVSVIVTTVSTAIPAAISAEVGLSYFNLSFKISDGSITLGQVLTASVSDTAFLSHFYLIIGPLLVIIPLTVAFFYLGLALSDATDPKTHR